MECSEEPCYIPPLDVCPVSTPPMTYPYYTSQGWSTIQGLQLNYTSMLAPPPVFTTRCPLLSPATSYSYYTDSTRRPRQDCEASAAVASRSAFTPIEGATNVKDCTATIPPNLKLLTAAENMENVTYSSTRATIKSDKKGRFTPFDSLTTRILTAWLERNQHHPYPSVETVDVLARACRLEQEQVRKWFSNKRIRAKKVKRLCGESSSSATSRNVYSIRL